MRLSPLPIRILLAGESPLSAIALITHSSVELSFIVKMTAVILVYWDCLNRLIRFMLPKSACFIKSKLKCLLMFLGVYICSTGTGILQVVRTKSEFYIENGFWYLWGFCWSRLLGNIETELRYIANEILVELWICERNVTSRIRSKYKLIELWCALASNKTISERMFGILLTENGFCKGHCEE